LKVSRKSFGSRHLFSIFVSANEINPDPEKLKPTKSKPKEPETQNPRKTSLKSKQPEKPINTQIHEKPNRQIQQSEKNQHPKSKPERKIQKPNLPKTN
jgi:hypothetical protein